MRREQIAEAAWLARFLTAWRVHAAEIDAELDRFDQTATASFTDAQQTTDSGVSSALEEVASGAWQRSGLVETGGESQPTVSIREAAQRKGVSFRAIREAIAQGALDILRVGEEQRVTLASLERWELRRPTTWSGVWTGMQAASTGPRAKPAITWEAKNGAILLIGDPEDLGVAATGGGALVEVTAPDGATITGRVLLQTADIAIILLQAQSRL